MVADKANPTAFLKAEVDDLKAKHLNWELHSLDGASTPHCVVDGKNVLMLCSNNYLNLSNHPRLKRAAIAAVRQYGAGSGSVRAIAGNMKIHVELEKRIASFKEAEAALCYQTGFAANAGLIPQLVGEGDLIISDQLNHGSIIDGVRLTKAERAVYKHCDAADLKRVLEETDAKNYRRILVVTDGVFSMDGDIAPMPEIVKLAQEFGAMTYVDDAHGDGVLGDKGKGIVHHFSLQGKVTVEMGTFSKAFGVVGGMIAGSAPLCEFAFNKSRTWLLSGSHPPAVAGACIESLNVCDEEPRHWKKLWSNTKYFKRRMRKLGFDIGKSETPITPVMCGESEKAVALSHKLFEQGVFALPIVFPMVARDAARIRVMMNAGLKREDLDFALGKFESIGKELKIIS
ncbi:MAG: aminotransferase class I/II-fold pyridoxal phosphate-dependent enzyme [Candidatus Micrarchaeota archaeon]